MILVANGCDLGSSFGEEANSTGNGDSPSLVDQRTGMSRGSEHGIVLRYATSQELCEALRLEVDDSTFGMPIIETEVDDDVQGREESDMYVSCTLCTDTIQVSSHPSGGGTLQAASAELSIGAQNLKDGVPQSRTSAWLLDGPNSVGCTADNVTQMSTDTASDWCAAPRRDTNHGVTILYFSDLILSFSMQSPVAMPNSFDRAAYLDARTTIFDALSSDIGAPTPPARTNTPSASSQPAAAITCGTYTNPMGDFDLVVVSGNVSCEEANSIVATVDTGEISPAFVCEDNPANVREVSGVFRSCGYHEAQVELRER